MPTRSYVSERAIGTRRLRRAQTAHREMDLAKAQSLYNAELQRHPTSFEALHGLGRIHYQEGRLGTALAVMQAALRANPDRAEGFATLGLVFLALRYGKEALASFEAGLRLDPTNAQLCNMRGVALLDLGFVPDALVAFDRVLAGWPDHCDALGNRANALLKLNRPREAIAAYDRALKSMPENAALLTNRAVALRRLDRPHEALMSVSRALASQPDFAQARFVESVVRLTLGDFRAGWAGYESRWSVGLLASQRRGFAAPLWLGRESLDGKTILLHAEQGSGDTIQFVRYASLVAARGAKSVIVEVQRELVRLVAAMQGIDVVARGEKLPAFDYHCPLLSLPLAFKTQLATIPATVPYIVPPHSALPAGMSEWRCDLPRIGLVWSGAPSHDNDINRSVPLEALAPLLTLANVSFVSLQHEVRASDAVRLRDMPLLPVGERFRDFADTAVVIAQLDAVIAVDTAVAHLAGAMGKPLFLLLPLAADFRWLRERQDSPWYPTARLFRQSRFADWDEPIATLRRELASIYSTSDSSQLSA